MHLVTRLITLLGLAALPLCVQAQCTPPPIPGSATVLPPAKVDSALGSPATTYFLCDNATLYYSGLMPDTIFMGGSARLVLLGSQDLTIYMNANCRLEIDTTTSALKHIRLLAFRPIFTSFQDTSFATIDAVQTCTQLNYDFSQFPGGENPCAALPVAEAALGEAAWSAFPNPFVQALQVQWEGGGKARQVQVLDALGTVVVEARVHAGAAEALAVAHLPAGLYMVRLQDGAGWQARRLVKLAH
jgi:hypothetical protein